jgi:hypothetical protein
MKHRVLAYAGVVLGVVALASSFAEPLAFASGSGGSATTMAAGCSTTAGVLSVDYKYSGFSGGVRGVDFNVGNVADIVDAVKGGAGEVTQDFHFPLGQSAPFTFTGISARLVSQSGKVIPGSTLSADPTTC